MKSNNKGFVLAIALLVLIIIPLIAMGIWRSCDSDKEDVGVTLQSIQTLTESYPYVDTPDVLDTAEIINDVDNDCDNETGEEETLPKAKSCNENTPQKCYPSPPHVHGWTLQSACFQSAELQKALKDLEDQGHELCLLWKTADETDEHIFGHHNEQVFYYGLDSNDNSCFYGQLRNHR